MKPERNSNMAVTYLISVTLALFSGALPAQVLGVVWSEISESMHIEIPYIALLRLLGGAGVILAVILSDRIRGYIIARDLIVGAIALEALALIAFSLSRELWNLCVWITALGFAGGLGLALICYLLRETYSRRTSLLLISSACGIAAGVFLVRYILSMGRSWRMACQFLAILQIVLCMTIFLLRRIILRDVAALLKKRSREAEILRQRRREELIREKGAVDESSQNAYLLRLLFLYASVLCCGLLLLSAVHLTYTAQVSAGGRGADLTECVMEVCAGMAAGRAVIYFLKRPAGRARLAGSVICMILLAALFALVLAGYSGSAVYLLARLGTGFGAGMVFPNAIQAQDERFDTEAQTKMTGLVPAFYLGADAVITPFVQSMAGVSKMRICILTMLVLACLMGACSTAASVQIRRK